MKITCIAPWFGSKRTLGPEIAAEAGPHRAYWEPFCGSCAVLFAKEPAALECVNDLHSDLINLAMVLASDRFAHLHERLSRTLYSEQLFEQLKTEWTSRFEGRNAIAPPAIPNQVEDRHVEAAWLFMVMSWMGRNGAAGTERCNYQMAMRWTPNGGSGPTRWRSAVESIPEWHERLRNVCILHKDAFECIDKIDDAPGTVIYCDPPYLKNTRSQNKSGGKSKYLWDFTDADHDDLSRSLARFTKARVIVSYYDDPELSRLYPDWTKRLVYMNKNLHVQNRRDATPAVAPEVLLINGPSYAA